VVVIEGGAPRTTGTASEEIALVEAEGLPALRRTQTVRSEQLGDGKSETVVFRDGFLPYSHRDVTEDYTLSVACRGTRVTGRRKLASGETVMIKTEVAAPVFDAHSVEMVLRVLPLAEDYAAEIPVFHAGRAAEMLVTGQVFGHETLTSGSFRNSRTACSSRSCDDQRRTPGRWVRCVTGYGGSRDAGR
jgi:hypothetical protein